MNNTKIKIIQQVMKGNNTRQALRDTMSAQDWDIRESLEDLYRNGYLVLNGRKINLPENAKGTLLRSIFQNYDITKILRWENEAVLPHLAVPQSVTSLVRNTGLPKTSVRSAIYGLRSIGAIKKDGRRIQIDESHEDLYLFARILKTEFDHACAFDEELLFQDEALILKKVPTGRDADGELTGFSLYPDYGVECQLTDDYYIRQAHSLRLEDVLIHSVCSAYHEKSKAQMIMCMIFYLKNRERLDVLELRRTALKFRIADAWIDIEGYVQDYGPKNGHLFIPREKFTEKAAVHGIPTHAYELPEGSPGLLESVGAGLPRKVTAYLLGGENMRIKGLKPRTKDCDLLVQDRADLDTLVKTLAGMGYEMLDRTEFSKDDVRVCPAMILVHPGRSRILLYTGKILGTLPILEWMAAGACYQDHQNLNLGILKNEDVFLLKSIACREADIQDMAILAHKTQSNDICRQDVFDWELLWQKIILQERKVVLQNFTPTIRDSLELLAEQTGTIVPFRQILHIHVTIHNLKRLLRSGPLPLKVLVDHLKDARTSGEFIRSRVNSLTGSGMLKKGKRGKNVMVRLTAEISFPKPELDISAENIEAYLCWRFPLMEAAALHAYEKLAEDLTRMGMRDIGQMDEIIIPALDSPAYEKRRHTDDTFSNVDALQVCMERYRK